MLAVWWDWIKHLCWCSWRGHDWEYFHWHRKCRRCWWNDDKGVL